MKSESTHVETGAQTTKHLEPPMVFLGNLAIHSEEFHGGILTNMLTTIVFFFSINSMVLLFREFVSVSSRASVS